MAFIMNEVWLKLLTLHIPPKIRIAGLAGILFCTVMVYYFALFIPPPDTGLVFPVEVQIERGMTPSVIASGLKAVGIIRSENRFKLGARLLGVTRKLQAGRYLFREPLPVYGVLKKLRNGDVMMKRITFPEGIQAEKLAGILSGELSLDRNQLLTLIEDTAFCMQNSVHEASLEGYLFPDTYFFDPEASPGEVLSKMVSRMNQVFSDTLRQRAAALGFSVHQALTLASIIEGEAVLDTERAIVSALYHNRLRRRMLLQADPTIQYIIPDGPRRLLKTDLEIQSRYNTYIYTGLPPGPVNNPGLKSIRAALYPAQVDFLYMVANGDGSHTFSKTMDEHIAAKRRFDRIRSGLRSP